MRIIKLRGLGKEQQQVSEIGIFYLHTSVSTTELLHFEKMGNNIYIILKQIKEPEH